MIASAATNIAPGGEPKGVALMKRRTLFLVILLTIGATSLVGYAEQRGPISILGNADFTADNGVVSGTGTQDDPYIIAGWEIAVPAGQPYGVKIENVSAHFVLRGLIVREANEINGAAIRIGFAKGGTIEGCTILNSINGIEIVSSTDIAVNTSVLYVNGQGLRVLGESAEEYRHAIDETTEVNDYPVYYYYDVDGETIEGLRTGYLVVAGSRNVTIANNEIVNGGICLAFVDDSTVVGNAVHRSSAVLTENGIDLLVCSGNEVIQNNAYNNRWAGIQLTLSRNNTVRENTLSANDIGIRLFASDENSIDRNVCFANPTGIEVSAGSTENDVIGNIILHENTAKGIYLELASSNRIEENGITDAEMGVVADVQASYNTVQHNTIIACSYGMSISGSNNEFIGNLLSLNTRGVLFPETYAKSTTRSNIFRSNVFYQNGSHVYTNLDSQVNWFSENVFLGAGASMVSDNGTNNRWMVDGVGNYWGDQPVTDENGDGIGDSPVTVYPSAVQDAAPLASLDPDRLELGILGAMQQTTIRIERQDGSTVELPVLVADDGQERWAGYRGFSDSFLSTVPGILFVFDEETDAKFTMVTVGFDLDIAYFDGDGVLLDSQTMTANNEDLYTVSVPFWYTLELPSGSLDELSLEPGARLVLPIGP
jgi:parallel beta-helix repeat protein